MHAQYFIDNFRTKCAQYAFFYKIQHCQSVGNIFFLNVAYDSWLCIFSNDFWWHPFIFTPTCLNFDLKLPYFPRFLIKFPISWTMSTWTLLLLVSTSETYSDGRCLHGGRGFFLLGEGGGKFFGGWLRFFEIKLYLKKPPILIGTLWCYTRPHLKNPKRGLFSSACGLRSQRPLFGFFKWGLVTFSPASGKNGQNRYVHGQPWTRHNIPTLMAIHHPMAIHCANPLRHPWLNMNQPVIG